tara:strand:- start:12234 stop:12443 length:210 start_codon:yes stop_codon:yes gene_type:complete
MQSLLETPDAASVSVDVGCKFVRVTAERADGLVAFDFAIGWPELSVELLLPRLAFEAFCNTHQVQRLDA